MNQTQINNFLLCLSHIDDANYLRLHASAISGTKAGAIHDDDDHADHGNDAHTHEHDHDHEHVNDNNNHDLMISKVVAMVVLFCATSLIGSVPFLLNRHFKWTESNTNARSAIVVQCLLYFGGGVLLCTTFLHLLPEVQETVEQLQECGTLPTLRFDLAKMLMCGGFFLMYLIEELIHAYIHRQRRLLETDAAGAAFERGHSVRKSHLMKAKQQEQQLPSAPLENVDCNGADVSKDNGVNKMGLSVQNLISNDINQQKYQQHSQELEDMPTKYSDQMEHLDHHHHNFHNHHHHHHHHEHQQHDHQHSHSHGHSHLPGALDTGTDMMTSSLRGLLIVLALSLHELFEGMAIGLEGSASAVWFMFGAVSAHKLVLAFCVAVELIVAQTRFALSVVYVLTFAVVSPLGIGVGILVSQNDESKAAGIPSAILQGLACGTLLYVVFFEILDRHQTGLLAYLSLIVGFIVMFGLQQLVSGGHGHSHGGCSANLESMGHPHDHDHDHHHHAHDHHDHAEHTHHHAVPTATSNSGFEQQLHILREASRELLNSVKKDV